MAGPGGEGSPLAGIAMSSGAAYNKRRERACCKMPIPVIAKPRRGCGNPLPLKKKADSHAGVHWLGMTGSNCIL